MSMEYVMLGLTPMQIEMLVDTPALLKDAISAATYDAGEVRFAEIVSGLPPEARQRLEAQDNEDSEAAEFRRKRATEIAEIRRRLAILGPLEPPLGLSEMWDILHYALAGSEELTGGAGDVLKTGEEIGDDRGYGPARLHDPTETAYFSRFIETLDSADLQATLNFGDMRQAGTYPLRHGGRGARDGQHDAELRLEFGRYFIRLQDYLSRMAGKGNGLLMWIT